ncbi:UDP-N-acetylmuramoyl-tripeptide--D-alanyl-D-alanine ligase [Bacillus aquiflavi]|uniref:UDP-N-acetylmuramoyl-tripeptide--D-alanyl-D-alanine ligase n=1 Tax=Bacillus aquiflavi TaxID=2672567 RepID=A0A6B3W028_9BACI|nr:UDP-N-acetylmuramoyl-tripeptide--D-alanyl-D-alanine ligase [Bacillus aquiflavi]MBA4536844.1 UDP-N-acetylmuramoyl-tripeptide--D-alanyl-D-alanine ligase [Bacillus aquiflavi]NEY81211.1 UDP-N-acetylmuramoyl-tripeptide--D-alanyl-D-alanine ligase [Bacillus aquiflavi]
MIQKTLKQLAEIIKIDNDISKFQQTMISGICIDSRKLEKGNLFVPLKGENVDGHKFVEAAIKNGAAAALWQKDMPNPPLHLPLLIVEDTLLAIQQLARSYRKQLNIKVIGITGSNGKTTTKDMTAHLLSLKYKVQKTEGNYNNHLGLPLTILQLREDTEFAVLEMGMNHPGEIDFLTKLALPDAVVITNIGESHLENLGSRAGIAAAKLEIMNGLQDNGLVVYYGDELLLKEYFDQYYGNAVVKTFGREKSNDLFPNDMEQGEKGNYFSINKQEGNFYLPVLGIHNVLNALAAMQVAHHFHIPFAIMNEGFAHLKLTGMRMELVKGAKGEKIINDAYNASPTSMKAAFELIESMKGYKRKIVVLGDILELGTETEAYHEAIGNLLDPDQIDYVFTYGKLGEKIADGAKKSFPANRLFSFLEKEVLITELKARTTGDEIILVKASRAMKLEQVVDALTK